MLMTLDQAKENPLDCEEFQLKNWLNMLDEYIKRDTPMEVKRISLSGHDECPACKELMALEAENFCDKCGHKIQRNPERTKMGNVALFITNLRHRGASKYDVETEIEYRKENMISNDEKCFGYETEELENALEHWEEY